MSNEEKPQIRSIIFWSIGLSILVVALTAITFLMLFPTELPYATIKSESDFDRIIPGLNAEFPTTGNHCTSDYKSYAEIQNPEADAGWIHYGNETDISEFMQKYCGMSPEDIEFMKTLDLI